MNRFEGHFLPIDEADCRSLVRHHVVGRLGWFSAVGQVIFPVNYVVEDDGTIVFRTSRSSILAELARGMEVAFEVDSIDLEVSDGWSVLVAGTTGLRGEGAPDSTPWAPGERPLVIAITPHGYSGRAVSAAQGED